MNPFSFASQQYTLSQTRQNYVFMDNKYDPRKRPKATIACKDCRRRKVKCSAAKTNRWPCSACTRRGIDCVRPNSFYRANDSTTYGITPMNPSDQNQQMSMQQQQILNLGLGTTYAARLAYPDAGAAPRWAIPYTVIHRSGPMDQHLGTHGDQVSYISHPITPPISAGPVDSKSDSPAAQSLVLMSQGTQAPGMPQSIPLTDQPGWNPSRIFEQWNMSFGTPTHSQTTPPQASPLNVPSTEVPPIQDVHAVQASLPTKSQQLLPSQCSTAPVPNFVTPAMWQESVSSVYEGGINKRPWDCDGPVLNLL